MTTEPTERTADGGERDAALDALRGMGPAATSLVGEYFAAPELKALSADILRALKDGEKDIWATPRGIEYTEYGKRVADEALRVGGDSAFFVAELGAMVHKAMLYKAADDALRYFYELKSAERHAYEYGPDHDVEIDETLYDELEQFLEATGLTFEGVEAFILRSGVLNPLNQAALEEEIRNGFELQDMLAELYELLVEQGDDPQVVFKQLGFPEHLTA